MDQDRKDGAKLIKLTQGQFAIVDDEDFERLNAFKWCAQWSPHIKAFYAIRSSRRDENGKKRAIGMHRDVIRAKPGSIVDHINHDTLDNRRENLRICTGSQNQANRGLSRQNTSGFKGVAWSRRDRGWVAVVHFKGKSKRAGCHETAREAAIAYDKVAMRIHGKFALTNRMLGLLNDVDLSEKVVAREQQMAHHSLVGNDLVAPVEGRRIAAGNK